MGWEERSVFISPSRPRIVKAASDSLFEISPVTAARSPHGWRSVSPLFCPAPSIGRVALVVEACLEAGVKSSEEITEILRSVDLMGTVNGTAKLADCDHKTVAHRYARGRRRRVADREQFAAVGWTRSR